MTKAKLYLSRFSYLLCVGTHTPIRPTYHLGQYQPKINALIKEINRGLESFKNNADIKLIKLNHPKGIKIDKAKPNGIRRNIPKKSLIGLQFTLASGTYENSQLSTETQEASAENTQVITSQ